LRASRAAVVPGELPHCTHAFVRKITLSPDFGQGYAQAAGDGLGLVASGSVRFCAGQFPAPQPPGLKRADPPTIRMVQFPQLS
jgi:hypothetical protein